MFFVDLDEHFGIERRLIGANLRHIIVDEADTLLDITFSPAVVEIIRRLEVEIEDILHKQLKIKSRLMFNQSTILNIMLRPLFNLFLFRRQYPQQRKKVSKN
jgi:superfamily II DNA/RNA helicase